jgi:hypothetical protein
MLAAIEETSQWTTDKIRSIKSLMSDTIAYVSASSPKIYSRELVETLFTQPYCRIGDLVEAGLGNRVTASKYLHELAQSGVLRERKEGRENLYLNVRFLELLMRDANGYDPLGPAVAEAGAAGKPRPTAAKRREKA